MTGESAKMLAGNIVDYRSGQQTAQMLAQIEALVCVRGAASLGDGMERPVYDRLALVHPHATGPLDMNATNLRQLFFARHQALTAPMAGCLVSNKQWLSLGDACGKGKTSGQRRCAVATVGLPRPD